MTITLTEDEFAEYNKILKLRHYDDNTNLWPQFHEKFKPFIEKIRKKYGIKAEFSITNKTK